MVTFKCIYRSDCYFYIANVFKTLYAEVMATGGPKGKTYFIGKFGCNQSISKLYWLPLFKWISHPVLMFFKENEK